MPCNGRTNKSGKYEWEEILQDGTIPYPSTPTMRKKRFFSTSSVRSNTNVICIL